ncbi:hypothetical protein F5876DRAFT_68560 [Lentinula aff. lateritia]|uniref:Uncharacterized protein n=1 Tax=Lentinula aff. lateritia TaxID=2804960 RepID=A0ACC1TQA8_9AGAR|nr:hypothetical protein F5876DRAFT_68560 [Lentinula aff. lateritia]
MSNTGLALEYDVEAMNTMALEEVKIQRGSIVVQSFLSVLCLPASTSSEIFRLIATRLLPQTALYYKEQRKAVRNTAASWAICIYLGDRRKLSIHSSARHARSGYATPIARPHELQARGLFYAQSQPLQLPTGSRCWFALNHNKKHDKSKRLNFEGNQIKSNGEKFLCGALPNGIIRVTEDRLCVLMSDAYFFTGTKTVYSRAPRNSMPNTVSFYITQMSMDHTLLTNEQINFTGVCYTQIETQKLGHLEIDWQNWNITGWPTNDDGTRIPVGDMEKHHKAEASMAAAFYSDVESD